MGGRVWTADECEELAEFYGLWSLETLAARLRRTTAAVRLRAARMKLRGDENYWTAESVGLLFGVAGPTVRRWIGDKLLRARRINSGTRSYARIGTADIERFIQRYPWVYDWTQMERGYFRVMAEQVFLADPLLMVEEAAGLLGISTIAVRRRIRKGRLPAYQRRLRGSWRWFVKASVLATQSRPSKAERGAPLLGEVVDATGFYGAERGNVA